MSRMALLVAQPIVKSGTVLTLAAASGGGDHLPVGESTFLVIKNGDASSHTVTLVTTASEGGLAVADEVVAVAAGVTKVIGPLVPELFQDPTDGTCHVTYDAVTTVTVGVFTL